MDGQEEREESIPLLYTLVGNIYENIVHLEHRELPCRSLTLTTTEIVLDNELWPLLWY